MSREYSALSARKLHSGTGSPVGGCIEDDHTHQPIFVILQLIFGPNTLFQPVNVNSPATLPKLVQGTHSPSWTSNEADNMLKLLKHI